MHVDSDRLRLSPSDLSAFLSCRHRTGLDLAAARGALAAPVLDDPAVQALRDRGLAHERAYVAQLRAEGLDVLEIDGHKDLAVRATATMDALRGGVEVVVQAALAVGDWVGYADVLRRVATPSALGSWSYEPYDTKLARDTRGGTILQLAAYGDLLESLQGVRPECFHVVTPAAVRSYRFADVAAYYRRLRNELEAQVARGHEAGLREYYPEPVEACDVCRWQARCHARRRSDDHLSFIAGSTRLHQHELATQGYPTLAAAAALAVPLTFKPARGSPETYVRLREQARLQHAQRKSGRPVHEVLPLVERQGLARLPEPSRGDLFLNVEQARFARDGGREYLFGLSLSRRSSLEGLARAKAEAGGYEARWAFDDAQERIAFEAVIDRIIEGWTADPGMHVYHFGHDVTAALKRLMGRYATRGDELDRLLRAERFVDLHAIVRQSVRAGVESYSIRQLEPLYGCTRDVAARDASACRQTMALALEAGDAGAPTDDLRNSVERDNRDTCRSVASLRDWLERLRDDAIAASAPLSRPVVKEGDASEEVTALESRQNAARAQLLEGLPLDACASGHPQHPYWLLAYLVDWHRRESKAEWWEYYRLRDLPESDLVEERQAIAGLAFVERVDIVRNVKTGRPTGSVIDRYRYPLQEVELGRKGRLEAAGGIKVGDLVGHDRLARTIDIKKNAAQAELHPTSVFRTDVVATNIQQEALLRFAAAPDRSNCGADLLFRREPRLRSGAFRLNAGETAGECAVRVATALDRTTLAIQGPPGAGKTHIGAQMIRTLVRAGKKVGVTATSHKVIRNLLDAVLNVSARDQLTLIFEDPIVVGHKCDAEDDDDSAHSPVVEFDKNETALEALGAGQIQVLGGTSWLWSREEAARSVDVLFIDEAGQMSLANALAVSGAAESLVLLGDPQQLDQPRKGSHPDGVGISALEHVLGGARTMPLDRGLFLPTTWRLHPSIAAMTSELFYEGKLASKAGLERQRLAGTGDFDGAGLWWVPVEHDGNRNASLEEVDAVVAIVDRLLAPGATWLDERHVARQLTAADLRVVAPFNAQVNRLAERLAGRGVPVGTVDKFQGQEAPVAIYSMATSRAEDAPRGMEFLYSLNRFNVATSRARCAAIVVASPRLLESACRTPRQITLANALCRYVELARVPSNWPLSAAGARESVVLLENGA